MMASCMTVYLTTIANTVGSFNFLNHMSPFFHDIAHISNQNIVHLIIFRRIRSCEELRMKELIQQISFLPVEKEGNFTARSEASLRVLLALKPSTTATSSSSSKSSISSTVSSFSWVESKDSDLDTLETIGDGGKTGGGVETATVK